MIRIALSLALLVLFGVMAVATAEEPRETVDIDFSHRIEITKNGKRYLIRECAQDKCRPFDPKAEVSLQEARVMHRRFHGELGAATRQLVFDMARNMAMPERPDSKIIAGKVLNDPDMKSALYELNAGQEIKSVIAERLKQLKLKESPELFILRKACNESHCRAFNGVSQDLDELIKELRAVLSGGGKYKLVISGEGVGELDRVDEFER